MNILEFSHATPEEEAAAKRVSKKLDLGEIYFAYNLPIQIFLAYKEEDNPKRAVLILMRHVFGTTCLERTGWMSSHLLISSLILTASQKMT